MKESELVVGGSRVPNQVKDLEICFYKALKSGIDGLRAAGQALIELDRCDCHFRERAYQNPGVTPRLLNMLEKIGRGLILPEIAVSASAALQRLPVGEQRKALEAPVDAVILNQDGTRSRLKVNLLMAPQEMVDQLVNGDHIRSEAEQLQYLAARANRERASSGREPERTWWSVRGKSIVIHASNTPKVVTRGDLLTWMRALEA